MWRRVKKNAVVDSSDNLTAALRVGTRFWPRKRAPIPVFVWNSPVGVRLNILIFGCPRNLLVSGHVSKGDILVVRYILRGVVYAFACQVIHVIFEPPLALVGWPRDLSALPLTQEKRHQRADTGHP